MKAEQSDRQAEQACRARACGSARRPAASIARRCCCCCNSCLASDVPVDGTCGSPLPSGPVLFVWRFFQNETKLSRFVKIVPSKGCARKTVCTRKTVRTRKATVLPACLLSALRLAHVHARAQYTRHARCTHASLASDAHMHSHSTCAHTSKAFCGSSCHWQLVDCRPARC